MHHRGLEHIEPERMTDYDAGYETLSDLTVIPTGVLGVVAVAALPWLRPHGVQLWMLATSLVLQLSA